MWSQTALTLLANSVSWHVDTWEKGNWASSGKRLEFDTPCCSKIKSKNKREKIRFIMFWVCYWVYYCHVVFPFQSKSNRFLFLCGLPQKVILFYFLYWKGTQKWIIFRNFLVKNRYVPTLFLFMVCEIWSKCNIFAYCYLD